MLFPKPKLVLDFVWEDKPTRIPKAVVVLMGALSDKHMFCVAGVLRGQRGLAEKLKTTRCNSDKLLFHGRFPAIKSHRASCRKSPVWTELQTMHPSPAT